MDTWEEGFVTLEKVAKWLGVTQRSLLRQHRRGDFVSLIPVRRGHWLVDRKELEDWIESRRTGGAAPCRSALRGEFLDSERR